MRKQATAVFTSEHLATTKLRQYASKPVKAAVQQIDI